MPEDDSLTDKVARWIADQGYPLEMQVARSMKSPHLRVRQSAHFVDVDSGKLREVDCVASHVDVRGMSEIHFVLECKKSARPWVLFSSEETLAGHNGLFSLGLTSAGARTALANHIHDLESALPWFVKQGRIGYNLTSALTQGSDSPYAAALGATKAAWHWAANLDGGYQAPIAFAFPTIVVDAPLFECHLDSDGEVQVEELELGWLLVSTASPSIPFTCVRVVRSNVLLRYAAEVEEMRAQLTKLIEPDVKAAFDQMMEETGYPSEPA